jgi:hypothetical protein
MRKYLRDTAEFQYVCRHSEAMIRFLVFNNKRGDEYAFIPLPVPVDVLEFCSIPQILPHALTEL